MNTLASVQHSRHVETIIAGQEVMDGAGVRIRRLISQPLQHRLDPFLLLDNFRSDDPNDYIAGFPDHPHRGFETITYMIEGRMRHRDSAGHEGLLQTGGVQWMSAARGVIHSEMPEQEAGRMEGFQLWLNLPANSKMAKPWYRDIPKDAIPGYLTPENVQVRVIAGFSQGVHGAIEREHTLPLYLDLDMPAGKNFEQALATEHHAFLVVYRGRIDIAGKTLCAGELAVLDQPVQADGVQLQALENSRVLLIAGQPLHEPIVQQGPFVMNSMEEIRTAFADYRAGRFVA